VPVVLFYTHGLHFLMFRYNTLEVLGTIIVSGMLNVEEDSTYKNSNKVA